MQAETWYRAGDGSLWDTPEKARKREQEKSEVDRMLKHWLGFDPHTLGGNKFCNGDLGYVQHSLENIRKLRLELWDEAKPKLQYWIDQQARVGNSEEYLATQVHPSWHLRMLDDNSPLSDAYSRLCCIDDKGREWGQPFYANNPDKAGCQTEYKP